MVHLGIQAPIWGFFTMTVSGTVVFQDDFSNNGPLDDTKWDFNRWQPGVNNPSYLGQTQMRQALPEAYAGIANITLNTFIAGNAPGLPNSFDGSEAITRDSWVPDATGGVSFEGMYRFQPQQGGLVAGFFTYQTFPPQADRNIHDELDFEIFTSARDYVSTNPYAQDPQGPGHPKLIPMPGGVADWHTYRIEWLADAVLWYIDGEMVRSDMEHVPQFKQEFHINLWAPPTSGVYGDLPGLIDVKFSDPTMQPAETVGQNKTYTFEVTSIVVERLKSQTGTDQVDELNGTEGNDALSGRGNGDVLWGMGGDDVLIGGTGIDGIDGGAGIDTAIYSGPRSRYDVSFIPVGNGSSGVTVITDKSTAANSDGKDFLSTVEFVSFSDGRYAVGPGGVLTQVTPSVSAGTEGSELVVHSDAYALRPNQTLTISVAASVLVNDDSDTELVAAVVTGPSHGQLQLKADGSFAYTPTTDYSGHDSFTYQATSADGQVGQADVTLYIAPVTAGATPTLALSSLAPEEQIATLYAGLLGRAADLHGFQFWVNEFYTGLFSQGASAAIHNIAGAIGGSAEAKAHFALLASPQGATDAQIGAFVDAVYHNLFDRGVDTAGQAYWTGQIRQAVTAGQSVGSKVADIISGAQDSAAGHDITALMNKVSVSLAYVNDQFVNDTHLGDAASATALLQGVTAAPETVLAGIKQAEALVFAP